MEHICMTMLSTSDVNPRRPPRHRRGHSLPAQLPSTILLPQVPQVARRHSIANPVTLDGLRTEIGVAWRMLSDVDAKLHETVQRIADMEEMHAKARRQLEDHDFWYPARYPGPFAATADISKIKGDTQDSWTSLRADNALVKTATDTITPLPYLYGHIPKAFPRRLAGLMALPERQVDGLMLGYGIEIQPSRTRHTGQAPLDLDAKRRKVATFIGIPDSALLATKRLARPRTWPSRPLNSN